MDKNRVSGKKALSFEEKIFLKLYREMYGEAYGINDVSDIEGIRIKYVKGQTVIFFFSQCWVPVGGYCFEWMDYGPRSESLKILMQGLDLCEKKEIIDEFYASSECQAFFRDFLEEKIRIVSQKMSLFANKNVKTDLTDIQVVKNMEIISSLAYLYRIELRSKGFKEVNDELKRRKKGDIDEEMNRMVWDRLAEIDIVPNF